MINLIPTSIPNGRMRIEAKLKKVEKSFENKDLEVFGLGNLCEEEALRKEEERRRRKGREDRRRAKGTGREFRIQS